MEALETKIITTSLVAWRQNRVLSIIQLFTLGFLFSNTMLAQSAGLFDSEEILELKLSGNMKSIFKDRGDDPQYHQVTLQYKSELQLVDISIETKPRGHFRKLSENCKYPPLFLSLKNSTVPENSIFWGQNKLKVVTTCRNEEYVVNEYLVYKLYNLITPKSFKARLVKIVFEDTKRGKTSKPTYAFLLEEEKQMALRNQASPFEKIGIRPDILLKEDFLKMAVFEYMIGNTDWSIQYQQNIKLLTKESETMPTAIPYDFDHAGIVRASYAKPAPELNLRSTTKRRYRGYCIADMNEFTETFETFNRLKDEFYALYEGNPLLSTVYQAQTVKFLDQFYETINAPQKAMKEFSYPCDKLGTGNIVIKGFGH